MILSSKATECYLKVSFPPYLLEVDLDGCIDSVQPRARVDNGTLIIKAKKKEGSNGLWGSLGQIVDRKSTVEAKARREESIKEKFKQEQEVGGGVSTRELYQILDFAEPLTRTLRNAFCSVKDAARGDELSKPVFCATFDEKHTMLV